MMATMPRNEPVPPQNQTVIPLEVGQQVPGSSRPNAPLDIQFSNSWSNGYSDSSISTVTLNESRRLTQASRPQGNQAAYNSNTARLSQEPNTLKPLQSGPTSYPPPSSTPVSMTGLVRRSVTADQWCKTFLNEPTSNPVGSRSPGVPSKSTLSSPMNQTTNPSNARTRPSSAAPPPPPTAPPAVSQEELDRAYAERLQREEVKAALSPPPTAPPAVSQEELDRAYAERLQREEVKAAPPPPPTVPPAVSQEELDRAYAERLQREEVKAAPPPPPTVPPAVSQEELDRAYAERLQREEVKAAPPPPPTAPPAVSQEELDRAYAERLQREEVEAANAQNASPPSPQATAIPRHLDPYLTCLTCEARFSSRDDLFEHLASRLGHAVNLITGEPESYKRPESSRRWQSRHDSGYDSEDVDPWLTCSTCKTRFGSRDNLFKHLDSHPGHAVNLITGELDGYKRPESSRLRRSSSLTVENGRL
jgi:hypothetical protein